MNSKRRVRRTETYWDNRTDLLAVVEQWLETQDLYRSCINCKFWQAQTETCGKFNARPPAPIIVNSCPDYVDEVDIPF